MCHGILAYISTSGTSAKVKQERPSTPSVGSRVSQTPAPPHFPQPISSDPHSRSYSLKDFEINVRPRIEGPGSYPVKIRVDKVSRRTLQGDDDFEALSFETFRDLLVERGLIATDFDVLRHKSLKEDEFYYLICDDDLQTAVSHFWLNGHTSITVNFTDFRRRVSGTRFLSDMASGSGEKGLDNPRNWDQSEHCSSYQDRQTRGQLTLQKLGQTTVRQRIWLQAMPNDLLLQLLAMLKVRVCLCLQSTAVNSFQYLGSRQTPTFYVSSPNWLVVLGPF